MKSIRKERKERMAKEKEAKLAKRRQLAANGDRKAHRELCIEMRNSKKKADHEILLEALAELNIPQSDFQKTLSRWNKKGEILDLRKKLKKEENELKPKIS
jgi:hypothetical protein